MNSTQKTTLYVMLFLLPALFSQSHSETYGQETNDPHRGTSKMDGIYWEIADRGVWGAHEIWRLLITDERHGTITVYGLYTITFYNTTETKLRIDFSLRFLDSSGKEIAEPSPHSGSPATLDAGELIRFPDVPFSAEFLNLTEVRKLDVVTVFASFDTVDDLSDITSVSDYTILGGVPDTFTLLPCYPNPFNAMTTIRYDLPTDARVRLSVFNATGQKVETLLNEHQAAGAHQTVFSGNRYPTGGYIIHIAADQFTAARKIVLSK